MPRQGNVSSLMRERTAAPSPASPIDFPVREYIGSMALELAEMARRDGDEALAVLLEAAGQRAAGGLRRLRSRS